MIKKFFCLLGMFFIFSGCATINIPHYIKEEYSYKKKFDADYEIVRKQIKNILQSLHWEIEGEVEPSVFETVKDIVHPENQQTLIFSKVRQSGFFVGSQYARVNVFLRGYKKEWTEIEIRYVSIFSIVFQRFTKYRQDRLVQKVFTQMQKNLMALPDTDGHLSP
ncbi:MAG TPA: hypothetical protein PLH56_05225 [Candidatus Omnitrophota bacterium]|nr:hypothetical protein [Candidatus Omnitrophota bacterium]HPN88719.1 hypothetical protein [Candidatus Omnitrophota bacterium]